MDDRDVSGLPLNRRTIGQYLFPVGALLLAAAAQFGPHPVEHWPFWAKVLALLAVTGFIFATVFVVLHHAEAVARRIGEPYGTLLLTFAVTVIEASVIVSMMLHGENNPTLARESVFSTVMIVCAGVVGVCLTLGGLKHRYQDIKRQGTSAYLAVLMALTVLTLILPNYTLATAPGTFSPAQLAFASLLSVLLYGAFVFAQMSRHRGDFIEDLTADEEEVEHVEAGGRIAVNVLLLLVGLAGIVLLTEQVAGRDRGRAAGAARRPGRRHRRLLHRRAGADARGGVGHQGGAQQRTAARPERRAGFGLRDDRPDHSGRRRRQPDHRQEPDAWPGVQATPCCSSWRWRSAS